MTVGSLLPSESWGKGRLENVMAYGLTVTIALLWFLAFAPLDPDPHHDGYNFAVAAGAAEGLTLNLEVFTQYGPATGWLHGLALSFFGSQLLTLRILTAILLAVTAVFMVAIAKRVGLRASTGAGVAILWVATCPVWSQSSLKPEFQLWPWPSVPFLLFQVLAVWLVLKALSHPGHHTAFALAGLSIGFATLFRVNLGGLMLGAAVLSILVAVRPAKTAVSRSLLVLGGWLIPLVIHLGYSTPSGSMSDLWAQSVVGPLLAYTDPNSIPDLRLTYVVGAVPVVVGGLLYWAVDSLVSSPRIRWILVASLGLLSATVLVGFVVAASQDPGLAGASSAPALGDASRVTKAWAAQLAGPLFATAVVLPVAALVLILAAARRRIGSANAVLPIVTLGIASLAQIYPKADIYHLWWAAPVALIAVTRIIAARQWRVDSRIVAACALGPFVLANGLSAIVQLSVPRVELGEGALAGMRIRTEYASSVKRLDHVLLNLEAGSTRFLCPDGLFAAWTGRYLADSPAFVDWAWGVGEPPSAPERVILCADSDDASSPSELATAMRFSRVRDLGEVTLSRWSSHQIYEFTR